MPPLIIAHRGWSAKAPENTLAAFRSAMEFGVDGLELDVHQSKDGHIVICHDERLERTTDGKGLIADHTLDELKRLDAGSWFDAAYAGEKLPTLEELFRAIHALGWRGLINIELKTSVQRYPGIESKVAELVREFDLVDQVLISSFNHDSLVESRRVAPELPTAALYSKAFPEPWNYARSLGCAALHPAHPAVTAELVAGTHVAALTVNAWTVDDPDLARSLAETGVDGIITNAPDRIREALFPGAP